MGITHCEDKKNLENITSKSFMVICEGCREIPCSDDHNLEM